MDDRRASRVFRMVAVVVVAAIAGGWSVPPVAAAPAIDPNNRPTSVSGYENGRLPDSELINVVSGCRAYRPAASSMYGLMSLARAKGVTLRASECYRSIDGQVEVEQEWSSK